MTLSERVLGLLGKVRQEVEQEQRKRVATFTELVDLLGRIELTGEGDAPSTADVRIVLERAGKTLEELQADVAQTVKVCKLRQEAEGVHEVQQKLNAIDPKIEALKAWLEEQQREYDQKVDVLLTERYALQDEMRKKLTAQSELRQLDMRGPEERVIAEKKKAVVEDRENFRRRYGRTIPALEPKNPAHTSEGKRVAEIEGLLKGSDLPAGNARRLNRERETLEAALKPLRIRAERWQKLLAFDATIKQHQDELERLRVAREKAMLRPKTPAPVGA